MAKGVVSSHFLVSGFFQYQPNGSVLFFMKAIPVKQVGISKGKSGSQIIQPPNKKQPRADPLDFLGFSQEGKPGSLKESTIESGLEKR